MVNQLTFISQTFEKKRNLVLHTRKNLTEYQVVQKNQRRILNYFTPPRKQTWNANSNNLARVAEGFVAPLVSCRACWCSMPVWCKRVAKSGWVMLRKEEIFPSDMYFPILWCGAIIGYGQPWQSNKIIVELKKYIPGIRSTCIVLTPDARCITQKRFYR